jgi:hypothetical protein
MRNNILNANHPEKKTENLCMGAVKHQDAQI